MIFELCLFNLAITLSKLYDYNLSKLIQILRAIDTNYLNIHIYTFVKLFNLFLDRCGCSSKKRAHDVYTADLLRLTDQKMVELKAELEKYKNLLKENRQNIEELQQKVTLYFIKLQN